MVKKDWLKEYLARWNVRVVNKGDLVPGAKIIQLFVGEFDDFDSEKSPGENGVEMVLGSPAVVGGKTVYYRPAYQLEDKAYIPGDINMFVGAMGGGVFVIER